MYTDPTTRLRLVAGPATEPLSLSEAKLFLRIEHSADDGLITQCIRAAREAAEQHTMLALLPQTLEFTTGAPCALVALPVGPAQTVSQVQAINSAGEASTVSASRYRLTIDGFGLLFSSPPTADRLVVTYSASLAADAAALPAPLKQGMLHHLAAMMEQRGGIAPLPAASLGFYQPYRRVRL